MDSNPSKKSVCQTRASQKALKAVKELVAPAAETAPVPEVPVPTNLGEKEAAASTTAAGEEVAVVVAPESTMKEEAALPEEAGKEAAVVAPLSIVKKYGQGRFADEPQYYRLLVAAGVRVRSSTTSLQC